VDPDADTDQTFHFDADPAFCTDPDPAKVVILYNLFFSKFFYLSKH
jgi:hypothetical protein